jgi:hypothetical protein
LFLKHGSVCDPEKKSGQKYGMQKAGCKNRVIIIQKEKRAA